MCVLDNLSTLGLLAAAESEGSEGKVGRCRQVRGLQGAKNHLDVSPPRFLGRGEHPDMQQPVGGIIHAWILH